MLTADQCCEFDTRGILCLPAAIGADVVGELRCQVELFLDSHGLGPASSGSAVTPSKVRTVINAWSFDALWGATVRGVVDELVGAGRWNVPGHAGQLLAITPANPNAEWEVPHSVWHLDYMAPGFATRPPGLQIFALVDCVAPRGGGTVVVAGSHRMVDRVRRDAGPEFPGRSAEVRKRLRRDVPWFADLCSVRVGEDRIARFVDRKSEFDGGTLQVVELAGSAGDVFVMHPWTLHAPASNCGDRPRMVVTERIRLAGRPSSDDANS